jgi:hypothetical protein
LSKSFHCDSIESGFPAACCPPRQSRPERACAATTRQLPIAANPAVAPAHVGAVADRVILVQLHIAQQSRAGVAAFEKIVAKDAILGEAPAKRLLEGIDVVDSLADERAFAEHVLVDIRDRARIGVDARLAAIQARIARAVRPGRLIATRGCRMP